jgi:hypothetical protein
MIQRTDLLALNFYEKEPFTGSDGNMRYRVEKILVPDTLPQGTDADAAGAQAAAPATHKELQATIWPGPFAFAKTSEDKKTRHQAAFSEEGIQELVTWMNEQCPSYQ